MSLATAIDALVAYVLKHREKRPNGATNVTLRHGPEKDRWRELDMAVWVEACKIEKQDLLPQRQERTPDPTAGYLGKTNLWFSWMTDGTLHTHGSEQQWIEELLALKAIAEPDKKTRKGRPGKGETGSDTLIISALVQHHGYADGADIENPDPATQEELIRLSGKSKGTISKFFGKTKGFGSRKGYEQACARGMLGRILANMQGEETRKYESTFDEHRYLTENETEEDDEFSDDE